MEISFKTEKVVRERDGQPQNRGKISESHDEIMIKIRTISDTTKAEDPIKICDSQKLYINKI